MSSQWGLAAGPWCWHWHQDKPKVTCFPNATGWRGWVTLSVGDETKPRFLRAPLLFAKEGGGSQRWYDWKDAPPSPSGSSKPRHNGGGTDHNKGDQGCFFEPQVGVAHWELGNFQELGKGNQSIRKAFALSLARSSEANA